MAVGQLSESEQAKFDEICQLLVAAGYFRARIPALSPFDKVAGGIVWCLTASSVDVEVEFIENATIGQKIRIGESVERALKGMKCAVPLQAHQLQGLDVEVLYPLVQWLVKQVYGRREEIESTMRRMSVAQFDQHCRAVPHQPPPTTKTDSLRSLYAPQRRCRLKETGEKTPMVHAQHVMLEYVGIKKGWTALKALHRMKVGLKGAAGALGSAQPGGTQGGESTDDLAKALSKVLVSGGADDEGDADAATGEEAEEAGEGSLEESDAGFGEKDLEKKMIAQLVGMGASDIHQHREDFAQKSDALMATGGMAQVYRIRSERDAMERRIEYENQQLQRELSQVAEASETAGAAAMPRRRRRRRWRSTV